MTCLIKRAFFNFLNEPLHKYSIFSKVFTQFSIVVGDHFIYPFLGLIITIFNISLHSILKWLFEIEKVLVESKS